LEIDELAEELRLAANELWETASKETKLAIVADARRVQKWVGSDGSARSNVTKWIKPGTAHPLPAFMLAVLHRHTNRDPFTSLLLRAGVPRMARVEPDRRRVGALVE
jgi:hypothetical protein